MGRGVDELVASGLEVIERVFRGKNKHWVKMVPLFSGGYDSLSACYVASQHPCFEGEVYHIDTGIGAAATRDYVDRIVKELGWRLKVYKSPATFERFVSKLGFPGPGGHQWAYARLKERCIRQIVKGRPGHKYALITGCRNQESARRMGHTKPVKVGETSRKTGAVTNKNRLWLAPCHDWSSDDQRAFMNEMGFPRNPIKDSPLGMSGECFCGAFATPNEFAMLEKFAPDVATKIKALEVVARECGIEERNCKWGYRDKTETDRVAKTGEMCSNCDRRAFAAGITVEGC